MPDDHSKSVPPLPIPNRTVKRLCADDSAATSVKVGYRQALIRKIPFGTARYLERAQAEGDFLLCGMLYFQHACALPFLPLRFSFRTQR